MYVVYSGVVTGFVRIPNLRPMRAEVESEASMTNSRICAWIQLEMADLNLFGLYTGLLRSVQVRASYEQHPCGDRKTRTHSH